MEKQYHEKTEGIKKYKELANDVRICMFTTLDVHHNILSRPMATIKIDEEGNTWFFTDQYSEKVHDIDVEHSVDLLYAHPDKDIYLTVKGRCEVLRDKAKIKELWTPLVKAWFPQGIDDPNLCLLKVTTEEAQYWNSSSNKMVVFFSMIKAAVTGDKYDEGEFGKIKLN